MTEIASLVPALVPRDTKSHQELLEQLRALIETAVADAAVEPGNRVVGIALTIVQANGSAIFTTNPGVEPLGVMALLGAIDSMRHRVLMRNVERERLPPKGDPA